MSDRLRVCKYKEDDSDVVRRSKYIIMSCFHESSVINDYGLCDVDGVFVDTKDVLEKKIDDHKAVLAECSRDFMENCKQ